MSKNTYIRNLFDDNQIIQGNFPKIHKLIVGIFFFSFFGQLLIS